MIAVGGICHDTVAQEPRSNLKIEIPRLISEFDKQDAWRNRSAENLWKLDRYLPAGMHLVDRLAEGPSFWDHYDYGELAAMLPAAVPALVEALASTDGQRRVRVAAALYRIDRRPDAMQVMREALHSEDGSLRRVALNNLVRLATFDSAAMQTLIAELTHENRETRRDIIWQLQRFGPHSDLSESLYEHLSPQSAEILDKAIGPLIEFASGEEDDDVRATTLSTLAALGSRARATGPAVRQALQSTNAPYLQSNAAKALGTFGDPSAVEPLRRLLQAEPPPMVRSSAYKALARLGRQASAARPELKRAADQERGVHRVDAALALWRTNGERRALDFLIDNAGTGVGVPIAAGVALGQAGPEAVPVLHRQMRNADRERFGALARALGRMGPQARPDEALLKKIVEHGGRDAVTVLSQLNAPSEILVPPAIRALADDDHHQRAIAARALESLGPHAAPAIQALIQCVRAFPECGPFDHSYFPDRACEALVAIGSESVPAAATLLDEQEPALVYAAADILGRIGPDANEARPVLARKLADPKTPVRWKIAQALHLIGTDDKETVLALRNAARDEDRVVRAYASGALASTSPQLAAVALEDPEPLVRVAVALALSKLEPTAAVDQALRKARQDEHPIVRAAATPVQPR